MSSPAGADMSGADVTAASTGRETTSSPPVSYHRRVLPPPGISFASSEGRQLFAESMAQGNLSGSYFALAENFQTQSDPYFCGLTTLAMSLNALGVDPQRIWKGPWRWYTEELLDCCAPTESVRTRGGISFREFIGYAECQALNVVAVQGGTRAFSVDRFRRTLATVSSAANLLRGDAASGRADGAIDTVLVCSYSRRELGQTGDGHFSPIGAYHAQRDLALVMDVARFKYPPHWVPVRALVDAMRPIDSATGQPRGYYLLSYNRSRSMCPLRTPREICADGHKGQRARSDDESGRAGDRATAV